MAVVAECCSSSVLLCQGKFLGVIWVLPYLFELLAAKNKQIYFLWLTEMLQ